MALQEQCDGCSIYWSTGEENKEAFYMFYIHACTSICTCAPPLPSHVFYQGDASGHQGQSESQDFPAPYPVNWKTRNAPLNDNICPTIALLSQRYF